MTDEFIPAGYDAFLSEIKARFRQTQIQAKVAVNKVAFPDMGGFSRTNIYRVRAFYLAYREAGEFVPQVVGQIPWRQNIALIEKASELPTVEALEAETAAVPYPDGDDTGIRNFATEGPSQKT